MAIVAEDAILKFGTQDEVTDGTNSSVVSDAWSVTADLSGTLWTNDDDAIYASAVLKCAAGTAFTAGDSIALYARLMNVETTNDEPQPDTNFSKHFLGVFIVDAVTATSYYAISDILLPITKASQEYEFYIRNDTAQTISANWQLWITPYTHGPSA
jgi:hypothetical protein